LDTQSRRLRLCIARRAASVSNPNSFAKCDANANTYGHAYNYTYGDTDCNAYSDTNSYPNTYGYTQSDSEAAPNATSSASPAVTKRVIGEE
jgi:hypothetical protein